MNTGLFSIIRDLLGAALGDQGVKTNPAFGATEPGDVDPTFKGDPTQLLKTVDTSQPYKSPDWATRFFHPDVAQEAVNRNTNFQMLPTVAQRTAQAKLAGLGTELQPIADYLPRSVPETASLLSTYGNEGNLNENIRQKAYGDTGNIPSIGATQANTDLTNSLASGQEARFNFSQQSKIHDLAALMTDKQLQDATFALKRTPMEQTLRTEQDYLMLSKMLLVDPKEIKLQAAQLAAAIGREPSNEQLIDQLLKLHSAQTRGEIPLAEDMIKRVPQLIRTQGNLLGQKEFESTRMPTGQSPFVVHLGDEGRTLSVGRDPTFVNMMDMINAKLQSGEGNVPLSSGASVRIPTSGSGAIDVRTGLPMSNPPTSMAGRQLPSGLLPLSNAFPSEQTPAPTKRVDWNSVLSGTRPSNAFFRGANANEPRYREIAKYLADNIQVPESKQNFIGSSNLKQSMSNYFYDALIGKNSILTRGEVIAILSQLPQKEQEELLSKTSKAKE